MVYPDPIANPFFQLIRGTTRTPVNITLAPGKNHYYGPSPHS